MQETTFHLLSLYIYFLFLKNKKIVYIYFNRATAIEN
jgi:hypothetical protein